MFIWGRVLEMKCSNKSHYNFKVQCHCLIIGNNATATFMEIKIYINVDTQRLKRPTLAFGAFHLLITVNAQYCIQFNLTD